MTARRVWAGQSFEEVLDIIQPFLSIQLKSSLLQVYILFRNVREHYSLVEQWLLREFSRSDIQPIE